MMREQFSARFQTECQAIARAPGRVNLIGEHTDYNEGYVLPIATEQDTWIAAATRRDGLARVFSAEINDEQAWPLDAWKPGGFPHWTSYVAGVAALLRTRGLPLTGFDLLVRSDVPPGGGLSSSAALEVATALVLTRLSGTTLEDRELIDLCRRAEHEFAGVPCGLMDQSVSLLAREGTAFLLDCRSREYRYVPCHFDQHAFVVIDSGIRHELATGAYARRQQECRQAVACCQRLDGRIRALREVSIEILQDATPHMDETAAARARHVVTENARTLAAAAALEAADLAEFGRLMVESHASLRDDYEVSCPELDRLVETVTSVPGVLGARMTGGGFGGCVVALALETSIPLIEEALRVRYAQPGIRPPHTLRTSPGRGASVEAG